jgi:hypothetical protein
MRPLTLSLLEARMGDTPWAFKGAPRIMGKQRFAHLSRYFNHEVCCSSLSEKWATWQCTLNGCDRICEQGFLFKLRALRYRALCFILPWSWTSLWYPVPPGCFYPVHRIMNGLWIPSVILCNLPSVILCNLPFVILCNLPLVILCNFHLVFYMTSL